MNSDNTGCHDKSLTIRTRVHCPGLISPTRSPWTGTIAEAFDVDYDRFDLRMVGLCEAWRVEYFEDDFARDLDEVFDDLIWAGATPEQIVSDLFDDPDAEILS